MGVTANSRTIVHSGDNLVNIAAPPDVCKTPSPAGPVPIPYVNIAMDSDLAKGAKKVKIEGSPVALEDSNLSTSSGDEPGVAGGLISNKFKGKMTWATSSSDVKAEGKGVVRFMDVTQHNGNSFNTAFMQLGGTGLAYGDDFEGPCIVCKKPANDHALIEDEKVSLPVAMSILADLQDRDRALEAAIKATTRSDLKAALEQVPKEMLSHSKDPKTPTSYMVGVMVCLGGEQFAAVSGFPTPEGFTQIATDRGCTVLTKDAGLEDIKAANPNKDAASQAIIEQRWKELQDKGKNKVKGYRRPGTCAGAKLMATSGHTGQSMTEVFYGAWQASNQLPAAVTLLHRNETVDGRQIEPATPRTREPEKDQSVPSCLTCQELLFMTRCDQPPVCGGC